VSGRLEDRAVHHSAAGAVRSTAWQLVWRSVEPPGAPPAIEDG
jgi:hypothetical protein